MLPFSDKWVFDLSDQMIQEREKTSSLRLVLLTLLTLKRNFLMLLGQTERVLRLESELESVLTVKE